MIPKTLNPLEHEWMSNDTIRDLQRVLPDSYFVGGCVRDGLLGRTVRDIDISTHILPDRVAQCVGDAGFKVFPTGIAHGTVTAVRDGRSYEITTMREDVTTDGRRATVAFTMCVAKDAARRDFTMNALYADRHGNVTDFFGGLDDMNAMKVRFVGDADARVAEDHLRILRLFRFHSFYGVGPMDTTALNAAKRGRVGIRQLSGERIQKEMLRLLESWMPHNVLTQMVDANIMAEIVYGDVDVNAVRRLCRIEEANALTPDPLLRLAAFVKQQRPIWHWHMSNVDISRVANAAFRLPAKLDAHECRKILYHCGAGIFRDRAILSFAEDLIKGDDWEMYCKMANEWVRPVFPLKGAALIEAGVPTGPGLGKILADHERDWIERDFPDIDVAELVAEIKAA